ncbi:hypothetical protein NKDENANG_01272 [Candidatus Entotheonellaceae bacterium PAL068K]
MTPQTPEEEQAEQGFTVSDKRLFTKEGRRKAPVDPDETPRPSPPPPPRPERPRMEEPPRPAGGEMPPRGIPPADFATFVAMLANNVMIFLGQIPDPMTQQRRRDIQQAKHTIDVLIMLRDKTRGNLTAEEGQLMQELLPQLQMAYVSASRQGG